MLAGTGGQHRWPVLNPWICASALSLRRQQARAGSRSLDQGRRGLAIRSEFVSSGSIWPSGLTTHGASLPLMLRCTMSRLLIPANKEQNVFYIGHHDQKCLLNARYDDEYATPWSSGSIRLSATCFRFSEFYQ